MAPVKKKYGPHVKMLINKKLPMEHRIEVIRSIALHDSPDGIRNATGCADLEEAFVKAIIKVEPAA